MNSGTIAVRAGVIHVLDISRNKLLAGPAVAKATTGYGAPSWNEIKSAIGQSMFSMHQRE